MTNATNISDARGVKMRGKKAKALRRLQSRLLMRELPVPKKLRVLAELYDAQGKKKT